MEGRGSVIIIWPESMVTAESFTTALLNLPTLRIEQLQLSNVYFGELDADSSMSLMLSFMIMLLRWSFSKLRVDCSPWEYATGARGFNWSQFFIHKNNLTHLHFGNFPLVRILTSNVFHNLRRLIIENLLHLTANVYQLISESSITHLRVCEPSAPHYWPRFTQVSFVKMVVALLKNRLESLEILGNGMTTAGTWIGLMYAHIVLAMVSHLETPAVSFARKLELVDMLVAVFRDKYALSFHPDNVRNHVRYMHYRITQLHPTLAMRLQPVLFPVVCNQSVFLAPIYAVEFLPLKRWLFNHPTLQRQLITLFASMNRFYRRSHPLSFRFAPELVWLIVEFLTVGMLDPRIAACVAPFVPVTDSMYEAEMLLY